MTSAFRHLETAQAAAFRMGISYPMGLPPGVWYVESNYLNGGGVINDCSDSASMVIRYNKGVSANVFMQTHGTKSPAGPSRGCRSVEVYNNYIDSALAKQDAAVGSKGGTGLYWNKHHDRR